MTAALSLGIPNFGGWAAAGPRALLDVARAAEDAGIERIVVTDHVVLGDNLDAYSWGRFPTGPEAPWLEPLTFLSAAAAVTSTVRLATGILIAPLRPAAVLAKTAATLDVLSRGRIDLGVGVGWQREEYDALGLSFAERGALLDETVAACRQLWTRLPASYAGEHVKVDGVYCSPRPLQSRLPVWFGGTLNARNLRRIVELGDGWIPIMGATIDDIRTGVQRLHDAADRPLDVQAPVRVQRDTDGEVDLPATMAAVPQLIAAGVTNVYVNVASLVESATEAPGPLARLAAEFRAAQP